MLSYSLQVEQETDGRWLAEVPELPGVMAYGDTEDEAVINTEMLALRVIADRLQHGETKAQSIRLTLAV
jgi:predicted RNase H-like HicB family nuclease